MKFLVCKRQYGEGCDYTIGCGMRFNFVEAESIDAAIEQTVWPDGRDEHSSLEGEYRLTDILIVPAKYVTVVDVERMTEEIRNQRTKEAEEVQRSEELAELERLQNKYGA